MISRELRLGVAAWTIVIATGCSGGPTPQIPPEEDPCLAAPCEAPGNPTTTTNTAPPDKAMGGHVAATMEPSAPAVDPAPQPQKPVPGDGVVFLSWPEQQSLTNAKWGTMLTDIARHLPASYGTQYQDADLITFGHETTHGVNSHLRNYLNTTGKKVNGFYVLKSRGVIVVEPNITKSQVAAYIPASLRESRFATYVTGQQAWDDTPLYLWDEWVAYGNGSEVGVDLAKNKLWTAGWRDGVMGSLEFTVYALAVGMAVEKLDPSYFQQETQFREFLAWNSKRTMAVFRDGAKLEDFAWDEQDTYYENIRVSADAKPLRQFVRRVYGDAWGHEVLGLDLNATE